VYVTQQDAPHKNKKLIELTYFLKVGKVVACIGEKSINRSFVRTYFLKVGKVVACIGEKSINRSFVRKPEGKRDIDVGGKVIIK
jgi:hypothetical protein